MMAKREYACTKCMWTGERPDNGKCLLCDSDIEPVRDGAMWGYFDGDFSWNKK